MAVTCLEDQAVLCVRRWHGTDRIMCVFHFGEEMTSQTIPLPAGQWEKQLDSADTTWRGPGSPVPKQIESAGEVTLSLPPKAFLLFTTKEEI
jgi:maltooligosyltrehalose trehalohydrolase